MTDKIITDKLEPAVFPSNELVGALLSAMYNSDPAIAARVDEDIKAFIFESCNYDMGDLDLHIVRNTADEVHLALPVYDSTDLMHAERLSDEEVHRVSGGFEIGFSILAALLVIGGTAGVTSSVAAAATAGAGIVAAGVGVATVVAGGVAGIGVMGNELARQTSGGK